LNDLEGVMLRALFVVAVLSVSGVAFAQTPDVSSPAPVEAATDPAAAAPEAGGETRATGDDAVICRTFRGLGSRLNRQRICRTRAEWRGDQQDASDAANDATRRALTTCIPTPGGSCGT
jgi:hypothetical protein